jgi:UDPglucose--hexose-1-phosphate uridylyltransferase
MVQKLSGIKQKPMFDLRQHAHSRLNPLTGEWVLVSPHRTKRPWQGKTETIPPDDRLSYDHGCYLCPGNPRADGSMNPAYTEPFVFTNDYSTLLADTPPGSGNTEGLLQARSEKGICRVISFSSDHSLSLPRLSIQDIEKIVQLWYREYQEIAADPSILYIQIFENKGEIMGCSNPHPHGQIWSLGSVPTEIVKETENQEKYFSLHGRSLLNDYLQLELRQRERVVLENSHFVALVPYWAIWPFETMIVSRRHVRDILQFTPEEKQSLAEMISRLTIRYDNLFQISFPYSAGMHQNPVNCGDYPGWHWHMHFYPPLLRSATIKKFMVGYELLAGPQRDVLPESAAETLRSLADIHYLEKQYA